MGMFDYVNFEMNCPFCDEKLNDFQSKDYYCTLEKIDPEYVNTIYASCPNCKKWIQLSRYSKNEKRNKSRSIPYTLDEVKKLGFELDRSVMLIRSGKEIENGK